MWYYPVYSEYGRINRSNSVNGNTQHTYGACCSSYSNKTTPHLELSAAGSHVQVNDGLFIISTYVHGTCNILYWNSHNCLMNGWNSALLLSGSNEHFSGATTGGRARNCKGKFHTILIASKRHPFEQSEIWFWTLNFSFIFSSYA